MLVLLDFQKPFILEINALGNGIRAVLSQNGHPIAFFVFFFSKKLSSCMQQYSAYVCELYALIEVIAKFQHYLFRHPFAIHIDH